MADALRRLAVGQDAVDVFREIGNRRRCRFLCCLDRYPHLLLGDPGFAPPTEDRPQVAAVESACGIELRAGFPVEPDHPVTFGGRCFRDGNVGRRHCRHHCFFRA